MKSGRWLSSTERSGRSRPKSKEHVAAEPALFSDELLSYDGLDALYTHEVINHAVEYVNGNVHTNGMENFWALLKRALCGTYVGVEPFHLLRYLDEQAYRFNKRARKDFGLFHRPLTRIVGRRLTYHELTEKLHSPGAPI